LKSRDEREKDKNMKKMLVFALLFACGDSEDRDFGEECEVHNELYSHTVLFCDGFEPENVEDVFQACNPRQSRSERDPRCVPCDLMEFEENCELQHVCFIKKAEWE